MGFGDGFLLMSLGFLRRRGPGPLLSLSDLRVLLKKSLALVSEDELGSLLGSGGLSPISLGVIVRILRKGDSGRRLSVSCFFWSSSCFFSGGT